MLGAMTAQNLFNALFNASLVVMLLSLVASLGMSYTLAQIVAPLRRVWVMVAAVVINCLLVPAVCWGICILFPLNSAQTAGIVLAVIGAGGPAGLMAAKLTKRADMALAISLTVVLQLANIVAAPLWANAVVKRGDDQPLGHHQGHVLPGADPARRGDRPPSALQGRDRPPGRSSSTGSRTSRWSRCSRSGLRPTGGSSWTSSGPG